MRFRVWLEAPGAEKPQQAICATKKSAYEFLRLLLDAGQPKGTKWRIYRSDEVIVTEGDVK
jgi:hypothetical protein